MPSEAVNVDNFTRAETDMYFGLFVSRGAFGKFFHFRELPLEGTGVRPNRDTFYSEAVFDLDAGPVTVTLPDAGERFLSMMAVDQDHYVVQVTYEPGGYTYTRASVGTRYVFVALRILVDPADRADVDEVYRLQDAVVVAQSSTGAFEVPAWDEASQKQVRDALIALGETLPDYSSAFGPRGEVDPVRHLIATATAWGGNPNRDAVYVNVTPSRNDGGTVYRLTVPDDVPVEAFWSVIVYNASGHLQPNDRGVYSLNSITAKRDGDGSITVQFGGCGEDTSNCIPTMPGWNYMVRLYRPRPEVTDGSYRFPEAQPVAT
ncbi:MAG TPA: DUF1214 domain-containing protein [Acidimicrobiales bacterium]|nr:DUF1214 domain-containing protein [Acidimicrobiales bacterium]